MALAKLKFFWLIVGLVFLFLSTGACTNQQAKDSEKKSMEKAQGSKIRVFKYDGSVQCEKESRIPIQEMQKELRNITVLSAESVNDGKIRSQVCGSPTGQMNVYEISEGDLAEAEKLGFKKWENP